MRSDNWGSLRTLAIGVMLAAGAIGAAACGGDRATQAAEAPLPPPAVPVVRATSGAIETAVVLSGNLAPQTRVDVHATLAGTLDQVFVRIGDRVGRGSILATLDRREIDAQVDAAAASVNVARAGLEAAEAGLANADQEILRARNLFEKGALSRQRLDAAETAARAARAQQDLARATVAQAEAALRRAREVQRDATLRSPFSGVVVERNFDAGNLVGPGSDRPVVAVADIRTLKLEAGVSELEAGRLKVGSMATITLPARPGEAFEGRLAAIAPEVDARNRHFQVELRVDNHGEQLLSGMYASARIVVQRAEGLVIPREAVFDRDGARAVYRLQGDVVQVVRVVEGLTNGTATQIVSGLSAGDLVVSDARRDVAAGARVRPVVAN